MSIFVWCVKIVTFETTQPQQKRVFVSHLLVKYKILSGTPAVISQFALEDSIKKVTLLRKVGQDHRRVGRTKTSMCCLTERMRSDGRAASAFCGSIPFITYRFPKRHHKNPLHMNSGHFEHLPGRPNARFMWRGVGRIVLTVSEVKPGLRHT